MAVCLALAGLPHCLPASKALPEADDGDNDKQCARLPKHELGELHVLPLYQLRQLGTIMQPDGTYLALKYAKPPGFAKGLFHDITKARLVTRYPHSGIVKDGMLMHSNLANGLHKEPFDPAGWLLIPITPAVDPDTAFELLEGTRYDWFSLLAFVLPWRVRDRDRLYCYEWCYYVQTGQMAVERVTPEDLAIEALRQKP